MTLRLATGAVVLALFACKSKADAQTVCERLRAEGVAETCVPTPEMTGAGVTGHYRFDIVGVPVNVPRDDGMVLSFETEAAYQQSYDAFNAAVAFGATYRFGSKSALILVQMSHQASPEAAQKAKALVEGL